MKNSLITRLAPDLSRRAAALLAVVLATLLIAPWFVGDYLLTVLIVIFYLAFTGQAWNIMMGFAGQLSLGHAIYAELAAYVTAALFTRFGVAPWLGLLAAMPVAAACGAVIGFLAFLFRVAGGYFSVIPHEYSVWPIVSALLEETPYIPGYADQFKAFLGAHNVGAIIVAETEYADYARL